MIWAHVHTHTHTHTVRAAACMKTNLLVTEVGQAKTWAEWSREWLVRGHPVTRHEPVTLMTLTSPAFAGSADRWKMNQTRITAFLTSASRNLVSSDGDVAREYKLNITDPQLWSYVFRNNYTSWPESYLLPGAATVCLFLIFYFKIHLYIS